MAVTTLGRLKIQDALPKEMKGELPTFDKKGQIAFFTRMAKTVDPDTYRDSLQRLNELGNAVASTYGGVTSIGLNDLKLPEPLVKMRDELKAQVYAISQDRSLSSKQRKEAITKLVMDAIPAIDKAVIEETGKLNNALTLQVATGMRGKPFQLRQLLFGDLLNMDADNNIIPVPTFRSYSEGITPFQYWTAAHGGRKGYRDLQFATADSGYFSKMVRQTAHRQVVTEEDCKNPRPNVVDPSDTSALGSLLFEDTKGESGKVYKKDTPITEQVLDDLDKLPAVRVRAAHTCGAAEGVCAKCAGILERDTLPDIGEEVGLNGVNSFLNPLGQSALDSKHGGGEASSSRRKLKGLKAVYQFINTPETFVDGAVSAPVDGIVGDMRPAPQGGNFLRIGDKDVYIPPGYDLNVKRGDSVEEGDVLTSGMVDMKEIVRTKGIGEARKIFTKEFSKILDNSNVSTDPRNIDLQANGYISKVMINDPDGVDGWLAGDIADYNKLASNWKPREGSEDLEVNRAANMYLEAPALHYTIGTRVTPKVAAFLKKNNVSKVKVNKEKPPFEPILIPAKTFSTVDEDFLTSWSGENLMRTLSHQAARGADSFKKSTSYYPEIAYADSRDPEPFEL